MFLLTAVTKGVHPQLPVDVRQLKPSLLLDKTTKKVSRLNEFAGSEPFSFLRDLLSLTPQDPQSFHLLRKRISASSMPKLLGLGI